MPVGVVEVAGVVGVAFGGTDVGVGRGLVLEWVDEALA